MAVCVLKVSVRWPMRVKFLMLVAPLLRIVLNDSARNKVADYCINKIKFEVK